MQIESFTGYLQKNFTLNLCVPPDLNLFLYCKLMSPFRLWRYNDLHEYWITKRNPIWTVSLPRAFECSFRCGGGEGDAQCNLCACSGRVECLFLYRAERIAADPFEAIGRIPVASSAIFDQPLLVYAGAKRDGGPVRDGDILNEFEVVCAGSLGGRGCGSCGWSSSVKRWDGSGGGEGFCRRLLGRRAEWRGCILGCAG